MKNFNDIKLTNDCISEAAEWFIKLQDDDLSEADYLAWQDWLARSPANKDAFARAEDCWSDLDLVTDLSFTDFSGDTRKLLGQGLKNRLRPLAAIAAAIVIVLSLGFYLQNVILPTPVATTYQTARAEHKFIQLEDGSTINLGGHSIVNVNYSKQNRRITLVRGEAVFEVAKNKARPFIVHVGKGTVTAIGTKFNILSSGENVTVTVLEGLVEVNPDHGHIKPAPAPLPQVSAGKAISFHEDGYLSEILATNVEAATSWEKGLLVRVNIPLASVIEDVNRYSLREIIIGDPSLNDIKFTGTVLNDSIDNWLRGLSVAYPIKVLDSGHDAILLLKKVK